MAAPRQYKAGSYTRLSREDGDKPESDSIINQQRFIDDFCAGRSDITIVCRYTDDGFTGTNFQRPGFQEMLSDIDQGNIDCVIVKDLSRFGRDYIEMGFYLERVFPGKGVRFIAINDNVDSLKGQYDMMLPLKNVFNTQYAKDISEKVRSSFKAKQRRGEFVGAFASYGYLKDPANHNKLVIDPVASEVIKRIFSMAAEGIGQIRIAKILNEENIPCPSVYKKLLGLKYTNCHRLDDTKYWTYSTIHRILSSEIYIGNMVQGSYVRPTMHGRAKKAPRSDWQVVEATHEAIIDRDLWDTVQAQVRKNSRDLDFNSNVSIFAGFLKCADCGRAMVKTRSNGQLNYTCGSYRRYGKDICSPHSISHTALTNILLEDLNRIIAAVSDLKQLAEENRHTPATTANNGGEARLRAALERVQRLKKSVYEDYRDHLLSKEEFLTYRQDYDRQEQTLLQQLDALSKQDEDVLEQPWVDKLLRLGHLDELDRLTIAQLVQEIRIFEGKHVEITYLFSQQLDALLSGSTQENTTNFTNEKET